MPNATHTKKSANYRASGVAQPSAAEQAIEYSLTVQAKAGASAEHPASLDLVDLAHYVASLLTTHGLPRIYTSAAAKVLEAPEPNQCLLDLSVDTFRTVDQRGFFGEEQLFVIVELSISLKPLASEQQA